MKRIARSPIDQYAVDGASERYKQLRTLLNQHLPVSTIGLFTRPKLANDHVEWYSELGGEPVPASQLSDVDSAKLRQLLTERLNSVRGLASKLRAQGDTDSAELLEKAARYPGQENLYSLNGQPVLTFWGHGSAGLAAPADSTPTPAPGVIAGQEQAMVKGRSRWWLWPLALLLLLLLLALLWYLLCPYGKNAAIPPVNEAKPELIESEQPEDLEQIEEIEEIEEVEEIEPEPEPVPPPEPDPIDILEETINAELGNCLALQKIFATSPLLHDTNEPRAAALKARVNKVLTEDCKKELIKEAKNLCPEERPKELAPELVIVFDASGSMKYSLHVTRQQIEQVEAQLQLSNVMRAFGLRNNGVSTEHLFREPKRITSAKNAANAVVDKVPGDVNIGFVKVADCPNAESLGFFPPQQHTKLTGAIKNIEPFRGTPLASGVLIAGRMLDGVNRESTMLVISDGQESCQGNPCAVAQKLAKSKPNLTINVVDILGTGAGNCLVAATGGKVFTANNADEIVEMTREAAKNVLLPAHCK